MKFLEVLQLVRILKPAKLRSGEAGWSEIVGVCAAAGWRVNERSGKQVLLYLILEKVFPLWPWTVQAGFPALRIFSLTAQAAAAATIETNNERAKLNHSLTTLGTMSLFPAERDANHPRWRSITILVSLMQKWPNKNAITGRRIHFESFFSGLNGKVWNLIDMEHF